MQNCKWLAIFATLTASAVASAQDTPREGTLEEVTVTAQRREQSLQNVPIAISAFSAEQIAARGITDTYDLVRNIPNLTGNNNVGVGTSSSYYIRGIGNAESIATFDVPVGTYVDDVYLSRQNHNNFALFDVERIEVLRGPQGTLFGRNTTGGAINVVMRKPSAERRGFVEVGAGRFGYLQGRASLDLPVNDKFRTKFSVFRAKDDGYARQASTGILFNDRDAKGVRADLRFLPTDKFIVDLVGEYVSDRNTNFLNVLDAKGNRVVNNRIIQGALVGTFTGAKALLAPGNEARTSAVTLNAKWNLRENLSFTSISGWRDTKHEFLIDSGGDIPRASTTKGFTSLANIGDHRQWSQEFKVNGTSAGDRLTWVAGIYYLREHNRTDFANLGNGTTVTADRTMTNGLKTSAAYAQLDYQFLPRWTLTTGLRYTEETKDFAIARNPGAGGAALSTAAIAAAGIPLVLKENELTPRIAVAFKPNDAVMLFVSSTRGFKSGGWPARATANNAFIPFKPEKIWSHELGVRADMFGNTLRVNATVFYAITDDIQIPARIDFNGLQISTTTNPADLKNHGLEIDATWAPTQDCALTAGVGLQKAKYINITSNVLAQAAACRANPAALFNGAPACNANFVDQFGNIATPVRAPDHTVSLSATYHAHLGNLTLSPTIGVNASDEYAIGTTGSAPSTNGTWAGKQTYLNADLTAELRSLPGLSISINCRNCQDKAYPMSALGIFQFLDRPGSWGANLRYKF